MSRDLRQQRGMCGRCLPTRPQRSRYRHISAIKFGSTSSCYGFQGSHFACYSLCAARSSSCCLQQRPIEFMWPNRFRKADLGSFLVEWQARRKYCRATTKLQHASSLSLLLARLVYLTHIVISSFRAPLTAHYKHSLPHRNDSTLTFRVCDTLETPCPNTIDPKEAMCPKPSEAAGCDSVGLYTSCMANGRGYRRYKAYSTPVF